MNQTLGRRQNKWSKTSPKKGKKSKLSRGVQIQRNPAHFTVVDPDPMINQNCRELQGNTQRTQNKEEITTRKWPRTFSERGEGTEWWETQTGPLVSKRNRDKQSQPLWGKAVTMQSCREPKGENQRISKQAQKKIQIKSLTKSFKKELEPQPEAIRMRYGIKIASRNKRGLPECTQGLAGDAVFSKALSGCIAAITRVRDCTCRFFAV